MDKIHGSATVKRNGQNIVVDVSASLKIGGTINAVKMVGQMSFRSESTIPSELEIQIPHTENTDLIAEQTRRDVEIQFQSDTGAVYVIPQAAQTGEVTSGDDGLVTLTYMGDPAVKA